LHARLRDQAPKIGHTDKAALQSPISVMSVAQTKYLAISSIRKPMRAMPSGLYALGWSWSRRWLRSKAPACVNNDVEQVAD
jgi:hypothetical protein